MKITISNKKIRKILILFFSLGLCSLVINSEDVKNSSNAGLDAIQKMASDAIENYKKLKSNGELAVIKVSYSKNNASEEEKKKSKENREKFQKYEDERRKSEKDIVRGDIPDELPYYTYTVKKEDLENGKGFNQIVSSADQRDLTLASINGLSSPNSLKAGTTLILPVYQGLYIPENPSNDFEILLAQEAQTELSNEEVIKEEEKKAQKATAKTTTKNNEPKANTQKTPEQKKSEPVKKANQSQKSQKVQNVQKVEHNGKKYNYIPGKSMSPTAKAFFLSQKNDDSEKMILPLERKAIITSQFGYRTSPITGKWKFHAGVDLAASVGTPVRACMKGKVLEAATNHPIYGTYVIISHPNKMTSTYAHLSKLNVKAKEEVSNGYKIGEVGTTGMSTGPHLHFEIREGGKPTDPIKLVGSK
ncbi:MAG: M23 family metallopeptidase [Treponema sp.]|nr:M23 family metallopeptidase [Treponema sp.]